MGIKNIDRNEGVIAVVVMILRQLDLLRKVKNVVGLCPCRSDPPKSFWMAAGVQDTDCN